MQQHFPGDLYKSKYMEQNCYDVRIIYWCVSGVYMCFVLMKLLLLSEVQVFFFFYGATAQGGPWSLFQYTSKPLDPLLYLSIH
jgi:uncharacterized membrane protein